MNTKKTVLIFVSIGVAFTIFIVLSIFARKQSTYHIPNITTPTPIQQIIPLPTRNNEPLNIIDAIPSNQAINVPLNQKIIIKFNRSFSMSDFSFSINPTLTYTSSIQDNILTITPPSGLDANVTYTYTVATYSQPMQYFSFTATNNGITPIDNTSNLNDQYNKDNYPDAFIAVRTPYSVPDFSITSDYAKQPTEHFFFTVTLKSNNQDLAKQSFLNWLKSTGLNDQQIQSLDIRYQ